MLDDLGVGDGDATGGGDDEIIPLPMVTGAILKKVHVYSTWFTFELIVESKALYLGLLCFKQNIICLVTGLGLGRLS